MQYEIAPSILSADFMILGEQLKSLEDAGCKWLHIDVIDGLFAPSISFGMPVITCMRKKCGLFFDVHMMVTDPGRYVEAMKEAGADLICVHAEACIHLDRVLQQIRDLGLKSAVALNPATPLSVIDYVMDKVDMVLLMSVNPGFGGQSYIPVVTQKIRALREKLDAAGHAEVLIEVDGGVKPENAEEVLSAGANILVAGSAVFKGDVAGNFRTLDEIAGKHR